MKLFKKRQTNGDPANFHQDRRVHSRFSLDAGVATLMLGSGRKAVVRDVSYSGIAAAFTHPLAEPDLAVSVTLGAKLQVLGASTMCKLRVVRGIDQGGATLFGFSFLHTTPEALLFLRELIEPMSRGASIVPVDVRKLAPAVRDGGWECYEGDGPCDIILRRESAGGPATTAVITFRLNDLYFDVLYRDGTLKTRRGEKRIVDPVVPGTLAHFSDAPADPVILRAALCVMMTLPEPAAEALKPVMATALATLPLVGQQAA